MVSGRHYSFSTEVSGGLIAGYFVNTLKQVTIYFKNLGYV